MRWRSGEVCVCVCVAQSQFAVDLLNKQIAQQAQIINKHMYSCVRKFVNVCVFVCNLGMNNNNNENSTLLVSVANKAIAADQWVAAA